MKFIAALLIVAGFSVSQPVQAQTTGFYVRQYMGQSITGQPGLVCVYNVLGREAHVFIGFGVCPMSMKF